MYYSVKICHEWADVPAVLVHLEGLLLHRCEGFWVSGTNELVSHTRINMSRLFRVDYSYSPTRHYHRPQESHIGYTAINK